MLARSPLNFIGNIEGDEVFQNKADVIVTTGFVGNILLKFTESIPSLAQSWYSTDKDGCDESRTPSLIGEFDYRKYGGASLLGVDGTVVVGHGRSTSDAVARAIRWAWTLVNQDVLNAVRDRVFKTRRAMWLSNPFSRAEGSDEP